MFTPSLANPLNVVVLLTTRTKVVPSDSLIFITLFCWLPDASTL